MGAFQLFTLISLFYVVLGVRCLYRVITRWGALWDDEVTADDLQLARSAAFFLLIPPTVALHELGHAALVWAQGLAVVDWMFLGYMGWVQHESAGPLGDFAIALAGNVVTLLIGVGAVYGGLKRPGHPIRNIFWIEVGRQSLFLVLAFYPILCLTFAGDFQTIYAFDRTPVASSITAAAHASILVLGYGVLWKRSWRPRALLLTSPIAARFVALEQRLAANADDVVARRDLGILLYDAGDRTRARALLERAIAAGHTDARTELVYGRVLVESGEHAAAIDHLTAALNGLLRPKDRLLAEIPLARALARSGRGAEAREQVETLMRIHPNDSELRELADSLR